MGNSTGSSVIGLVPGLPSHLGGGIAIMYVDGNPSGIISPFPPGGEAASCGVSGAAIAYDTANDTLYKHIGGTANKDWQLLGSTVFP